MSNGDNFEDRLADALDEMVGDDGIALLRKQSWQTRRGNFQMSQEADVLVDSPDRNLYSAFECKSRSHAETREKGLTGLYFSGDYKSEQIEKQAEYRDKSGRRFFVGVELRDFRGADVAAFLVPLELFEIVEERGDSKVTWEQIAYMGRYIGGEEIEVTRDDLDAVEAVGLDYADDPDMADQWVEQTDDGETVPVDEFPPVEV